MSQILKWIGHNKTQLRVAFLGGYESRLIDLFTHHMRQYGIIMECIFTGNSILESDVNKAIHSSPHVIYFHCNNAMDVICR